MRLRHFKQPTWQVIFGTHHLWLGCSFSGNMQKSIIRQVNHAKLMEAENDSMSKFLPFSCEPAFLVGGCSLTIADHYIISTILSCLTSVSVIFMCKPLFSTDIHLRQCTVYSAVYINNLITTINIPLHQLWHLSTKFIPDMDILWV